MTGAELPLDGLRVLDYGQYVASPFATMLLSDLGADVIKVEPPSGDEWRRYDPFEDGESRYFYALNRGKRSVALDLKSPEGRERSRALIASADALVHNCLPERARRFGLDSESVRAVNPRCVTVCVSAFGSSGPDSNRPAYDLIGQALSGLLLADPRPGDAVPRRTGGLALADFTAGLLAAVAVTAGLLGRGERAPDLEVSLLGAALALQAQRFVEVDGRDEPAASSELAGRAELEALAGRAAALEALDPYYRAHACADGFIALACLNSDQRRQVCELLALDDPVRRQPAGRAGGRRGARPPRRPRARRGGRLCASRRRRGRGGARRTARARERGAEPRPALRRCPGALERPRAGGRATGGRSRAVARQPLQGRRRRRRAGPPGAGAGRARRRAARSVRAPMRVVTDLPRPVRTIDHVWIPLSDGTRLGARIWLPEDAESDPVPAILEYIPYRKGDGTALRDQPRHAYFAGHGYAVLRVDQRGSGESDGLLHDEYLPQEQEDAVEVLRWIAEQPWCTGAAGMFGISWGGFNGLQVAARRPPELKAVISLCSTDDRYADDVHYRGGAVLALEMLSWGASMLSFNAIAPDPEVAGPGWRDAWLERIDSVEPYEYEWLRHQRRDDYWKQGSVCEDFGAIECPVYAIGGWADGYSEAVLRLVAGLGAPSKGLIGPWSHSFPDEVEPGPGDRLPPGVPALVGPVAEGRGHRDHGRARACASGCRSRWLRRPDSVERPGPLGGRARLAVARRSRSAACGSARAVSATSPTPPRRRLEIGTDLLCGIDGGVWCADGTHGEGAVDQRADDGRALSFTSAPLDERIELLGNARVELELESDRPVAQLAARLCDVAPDGSSLLVTRGVLNLTHRDSHEHPQPLEPGRRERIVLELDGIAQAIPAGHRLRLALSPAYWPWLWPAPEPVTLAIHTADSSLVLPVRPPRAEDEELRPFDEPESAPGLEEETLEPVDGARTVTRDFASERHRARPSTGPQAGATGSWRPASMAGCWTETSTRSCRRPALRRGPLRGRHRAGPRRLARRAPRSARSWTPTPSASACGPSSRRSRTARACDGASGASRRRASWAEWRARGACERSSSPHAGAHHAPGRRRSAPRCG